MAVNIITEPIINATMSNASYKGEVGPIGPRGPAGRDANYFAFEMKNGDLYVISNNTASVQDFYIDEDGNLIFKLED